MDNNDSNVTNMIQQKGYGKLFQIMKTTDNKKGCFYPNYFENK